MWQRLSLIAFITCAFFLLAACGGRGGPVPYEPVNFGKPDDMSASASLVPGPQRLGALDKVKITVFQSEDLSGEFQVDNTGKIDFPLIGAVAAQGKTTEELRQTLASRLGERYLQNPNVQVSLISQNEQIITVDGSVNGPGVFTVKGPTTLMRAIALARGAAPDANLSRVVVFRTINGERMAGAFDLADIRRAKVEDPVIYGNDIVIVDGSRAQRLFSQLMGSIPLLSVLRPY
jgi:polysaccharide export outer membrane protein